MTFFERAAKNAKERVSEEEWVGFSSTAKVEAIYQEMRLLDAETVRARQRAAEKELDEKMSTAA